MSQRVVVGLSPDADWTVVKQQLKALGADSIRDPYPEDPAVAVVTLPPGRDSAEFASHVERVPGVRYAEPEVWRTT